MIEILRSILDSDDPLALKLIDKMYNTDVLSPKEKTVFAFIKTASKSGRTPSVALLCRQFSDLGESLQNASPLTLHDAHGLFENFVEQRHRSLLSQRLICAGQAVGQGDLSDQMRANIRDLLAHQSEAPELPKPSDFAGNAYEKYLESKSQGQGLSCCVPALDNVIGGMEPGTLTTVMAYTGQFKTTHGAAMVYDNAILGGHNMCHISLEQSRSEILHYHFARHSLQSKFEPSPAIERESIRRKSLSHDQEQHLFEVVVPDLYENCDGLQKGMISVLERPDFRTLSIEDVFKVLEKVDDQCIEATGQPVKGFVWDYIQYIKYCSTYSLQGRSEFASTNAFIHQISEWAKDFRGQKTVQIMLAQTNREGWKQAVRNGGHYQSSALAEVNEAERASSLLLSIFTDPKLIACNEVLFQCHKTRYGTSLSDPIPVRVAPQYAFFGDEEVGLGIGSLHDFDALFSNSGI